MNSLDHFIQQGNGNAWILIPTAILIGALHGLEPGHSKTMMAAFIVAVRGTVAQAVLLGLSAAFSHSLVIWLLAAVGLKYGSHWKVDQMEPYLQMISGVIIISVAIWIFLRTRREITESVAHDHHHHEHHHHHGHHHAHEHQHEAVEGFQDTHERQHALEIAERFQNRSVSTGQIILFGLSGGLIPCPAAVTILLLCLQLKQFVLGFTLVLAFSAGLALTMVAIGAAAAWGVQHATTHMAGFESPARRAPYFSSGLMLFIGLFIGIQGLLHIVK